tara:strand:+ start:14061 stop:14810 length:750 start_codon:yes stop_codon:yes gene_type:complete
MEYKYLLDLCKKKNIEFYYFEKVNSTMDVSKKLFFENKSTLLICSAQQTSGRGRLGNKWISNKGNIFFSLRFVPKVDLKKFYQIGILSCISIKKTLKKFGISNVSIKWPNDIIVENMKIGGVLTETFFKNNYNYCTVGIGINFINSPTIKKYSTTYIKKYNSSINFEIFLTFLIKMIINSYNKWNDSKYNNLIDEYKKSLIFFGKEVIINNNNNLIKGILIDVTKDGYLVLNSNNKKRIIQSGFIEFKL